MTDQVTEQNEATEPEAPVFPDEMARMSFETLKNLIDQRNSEVGKVNAVKGDRQTLTEQISENSTEPEIVAARSEVAKAQEVLDEAVMALHAVVTPVVNALLEDAEASVKETEEAIKKHDETIKPGLNYFKKMYGEHLAKHLPSLARLKGFTTKGAGATGKRVRGYVVDVTVDGETRHFDNLATAAKYLDLETAQLQAKFFEAAGNPEKLKDAPNRVDFTVEFTETYEDDTQETKTAGIVALRESKDEAPAEAEAEAEESEEEDSE